jgi:hypothetical protein
MITRGTFLNVGGKRLLRSALPADLAWRAASGAVTVEAEPAYKATGGADTIGVGGLVSGNSYSIVIDGKSAINLTADTGGSVSFMLDLKQRSLISVKLAGSVNHLKPDISNDESGYRMRSLPGRIEVSITNGLLQPAILTAFAIDGRLLKRWTLSGNMRYCITTNELLPGICILRIESNLQPGPLQVVRILR